MTCEIVKLPDDTSAIVCGSRRRPARCFMCERRGLYQCDAAKGDGTCDRYLCDVHRISAREGVDFCPPHARAAELIPW
jgi:hypothetical protein